MQSDFEALLADPLYRRWFEGWWEADWSVDGLQRRGLDWRLPRSNMSKVGFAGRTWSPGRMPPHDLDGNLNDDFFNEGWFDWDDFLRRLRQTGRTEFQLDGGWLPSLTPGQGSRIELSARQSFVLGDVLISSAGVSQLDAKGLYVGGKLHLIDASLTGRAVLSRSVIRRGVAIRKVSGSSVHLHRSTIEGDVLAETVSELDVSKSKISGDLVWETSVSRLDGFGVQIAGALRLSGSGGSRAAVIFQRASLGNGFALSNAYLSDLKLGGSSVQGDVALMSCDIEALGAGRIVIGGSLSASASTIGACVLRNASIRGGLELKKSTIRSGVLEGASIGGNAAVIESNFATLDAASVDFQQAAIYDRTTFSEAVSFNGSEFRGPTSFAGAAFLGRSSFVKCRFKAGANFAAETEKRPGAVLGGDAFGSVSFQASTFVAPPDAIWCVDFEGRQFRGSSVFDGCSFHGAPRFFQAAFHENASFRYTRFQRAPHPTFRERRIAFGRHAKFGVAVRATLNAWNKEHQQYEHAYRSLKLRMNQIGSGREERRFLALELRARRARADQEVRPLESLLSFAYDLTSDYGESILRPLVWTTLVTIAAAGVYYAAAAAEIAPLHAVEFAVRQVFKPFNVWADGGAVIGPSDQETLADVLLGRRPDTSTLPLGMKFLASLQSLACLTLLFLSALAIRKRFRLT